MRDALGRADLAWLALLPLGLALNYAGFAAAWRTAATIRDGAAVGWWSALRVVALRSGATLLVGGGALAVDGWAMRRLGKGLRDVVQRVLGLDFARFSSLCVVGGVASVTLLATGRRAEPGLLEGWTAALGLLVAIGYAPVRLRKPRPEGRIRTGVFAAMVAVGLARQLLRNPLRTPGSALGLPLFWLGNLLLVYAATRALGIGIGIGELVVAYATAQLLLLVPFPVGASGGYEATLAWLLTLFGAPLAAALPAAFLYRLCGYWLPAAISFAFASSLRRLGSDLDTDGEGEDLVGEAGDDREVTYAGADREHAVRHGSR